MTAYNQFQSDGACQTTCQESFAYAILQGTNCWCSNFAPADQTDTGSCNSQCPGFPTDLCGNQGAGLFGYYQLGNVQPSGTIGAAAASTPSAAASSSPPVSVHIHASNSHKSSTPRKPNPFIACHYIQPCSLSFLITTPYRNLLPPQVLLPCRPRSLTIPIPLCRSLLLYLLYATRPRPVVSTFLPII